MQTIALARLKFAAVSSNEIVSFLKVADKLGINVRVLNKQRLVFSTTYLELTATERVGQVYLGNVYQELVRIGRV